MTMFLVSFIVGLVSLCIGYYFGKRFHMYYLFEAIRLINESKEILSKADRLHETMSQSVNLEE